MEKYEEIKESKKKLDKLNEDEKEQNMALLREKSLHDEATRKERYFNEGKLEGIEEGKVLGKSEGIAEGEKSRSIEIAKELLKEKMSIERISQITELSLEEIEGLRSANNE